MSAMELRLLKKALISVTSTRSSLALNEALTRQDRTRHHSNATAPRGLPDAQQVLQAHRELLEIEGSMECMDSPEDREMQAAWEASETMVNASSAQRDHLVLLDLTDHLDLLDRAECQGRQAVEPVLKLLDSRDRLEMLEYLANLGQVGCPDPQDVMEWEDKDLQDRRDHLDPLVCLELSANMEWMGRPVRQDHKEHQGHPEYPVLRVPTVRQEYQGM